MFSDIWNKIKEMVRKMMPKKSIEEVLHITPAVSDRMADAIQLWAEMYEGRSPWLKEPNPVDPTRIVSLGLPALIASEKARMATLELKSEITAPVKQEPKSASDDGISAPLPGTESAESRPNVGAGSTTTTSSIDGEVPEATNERVDFLNKQYKKLKRQIRRQLEYGIAKGGLVIKPYIVINDDTGSNDTLSAQSSNSTTKTQKSEFDTNNSQNRLSYDKSLDKAEIEFDFVQADRFFPLSFDANGKVVEAAFIQSKVDKARERVYFRLEYHKLVNHTVTVQNLAFESDNMSLANSNNLKSATDLGRPIPLTAVPEWANMDATTVIEDVDRLLFAYFKMPEANTVDPYSPLGVSGYSRVVNLIRDADMQYSRLLWEFEAGEMAIDVDRDALKFVTDLNGEGYSVLPEKQQRLFRKVDLNAEDTYNVFAPPLRDVSISNGLNTILCRIEDATGLSRGTLSEITNQEARTATELKILKQRSFATNEDIQTALQDALDDAIYVMDAYCTLYDVTPDGEYEVSYEWDDSIIIDAESELSKRLTLMQNGLASKLETRMWYFGETESQAKMALEQIDLETQQATVRNMETQQMLGGETSSDDDGEDDNAPNPSGSNTKKAGDTTSAKKSTGQQADTLDNPNKSQTAQKFKK